MNFEFYEFWHFLKDEIDQINKIQSPINGKYGSFTTSRIPKINFT